MKRGDVYRADLNPVQGSEQGGIRPVVIVQNDLGNQSSPTVIVAPLTTQRKKRSQPTHVEVLPPDGGLKYPSMVLCEQLRTVEKSRLDRYIGHFSLETLRMVDAALLEALGTGKRN